MDLRFEWDVAKASANQRKHRISFDEAQEVFFDDHALLMADPDHSTAEDRFVILGLSRRSRLLVVCHCYRQSDEVIRLISARRAGTHERRQYFQRWNP